MIISASRRTDIPAFFSPWLMNRLREGFVCTRNPFNAHQVSRVSLDPAVVDAIVFWTKNAGPLLPHLDEVEALGHKTYYFQYTLTGYGKDVEPKVPDIDRSVRIFSELSERLGPERVIWRYDPIFLSPAYDEQFHFQMFESIARRLEGRTDKCVISFVDLYEKTKRNMAGLDSEAPNQPLMQSLANGIAERARACGMAVETCSEKIDLEQAGITHGHCIDRELIESIGGFTLKVGKDKTQRAECGCFSSIDIGAYNTCAHGCRYCYANFNDAQVQERLGRYDKSSPLLCDQPLPTDNVTDRKVKSLKDLTPVQSSLF